jgi:uncharacterized membrane protein YphA (DoxX/SURF4 family)
MMGTMSSAPTLARRLEQTLDRLHARARASLLLRYFATVNRILLAIGFVPTGLVKIRGERFTAMDLEHPIGFFFEAMYRTGAYWQFIGWAQAIGGVLLLIPATSTLGAVIFFPLILNIFIITVSLEFTGTPFVTGGMLLANLFLLCWDWHRLKPILFADAAPVSLPAPVEGSALATRLERAGYVVSTAGGMLFFLWTRAMVPRVTFWVSLGIGLVGGILLLVSLVQHRRGGRPDAKLVPAS